MLDLPQNLTQTSASGCLAQLSGVLRGLAQQEVVVNASALQQFDSAALAVLLALRRQALAAGKALTVQSIPSRLADLSRLYGVNDLLGITSAQVASNPP